MLFIFSDFFSLLFFTTSHFLVSNVIFSFEESSDSVDWLKEEKDNTEIKIANISFFMLPPVMLFHGYLRLVKRILQFFLFFLWVASCYMSRYTCFLYIIFIVLYMLIVWLSGFFYYQYHIKWWFYPFLVRIFQCRMVGWLGSYINWYFYVCKTSINIIGMFCISVADVITYGYQ